MSENLLYEQKIYLEGTFISEVDRETVETFIKDFSTKLHQKRFGESFIKTTKELEINMPKKWEAFTSFVESTLHICFWPKRKKCSLIFLTQEKVNSTKLTELFKEHFQVDDVTLKLF